MHAFSTCAYLISSFFNLFLFIGKFNDFNYYKPLKKIKTIGLYVLAKHWGLTDIISHFFVDIQGL